MGKPENMDQYDEHNIDGIKIFVKSDVIAKDDELRVKHSKVLWSEKLVIEGMMF